MTVSQNFTHMQQHSGHIAFHVFPRYRFPHEISDDNAALEVMMMAVTAAVALYDDIQRKQADYEINMSDPLAFLFFSMGFSEMLRVWQLGVAKCMNPITRSV